MRDSPTEPRRWRVIRDELILWLFVLAVALRAIILFRLTRPPSPIVRDVVVTRVVTLAVQAAPTLVPAPTPPPQPTATIMPTNTPAPDTPTPLPTETSTPNYRATSTAEWATATIVAYKDTAPQGSWCGYAETVVMCVGNFRYLQSTSIYASGVGMKFVGFTLLIASTETGSEISVNPNDFTLVDLDGGTHGYNVATYDYWQNPLDAVNVLPGNNTSGGLVFKIGAHTGPAQIVYQGFLGPRVIVDLTRPPNRTN